MLNPDSNLYFIVSCRKKLLGQPEGAIVETKMVAAKSEESVECKLTLGDPYILLHPQNNKMVKVKGGIANINLDITYRNTIPFMRQLIEESSDCKQRFYVELHHVSPKSVYLHGWDGTIVKMDSSDCIGCDGLFRNVGSVGWVLKKDFLPLRGIHLGDMNDKHEYANIKFDEVLCQEKVRADGGKYNFSKDFSYTELGSKYTPCVSDLGGDWGRDSVSYITLYCPSIW